MIYLLRIPKFNDYRLTKEECRLLGIDWIEDETNYELIILSSESDKLGEAIEDALGVISAKQIRDGVWEVKGYDEVQRNCDIVFNEHGVMEIRVTALDYKDLERFYAKPSMSIRLYQYCF